MLTATTNAIQINGPIESAQSLNIARNPVIQHIIAQPTELLPVLPVPELKGDSSKETSISTFNISRVVFALTRRKMSVMTFLFSIDNTEISQIPVYTWDSLIPTFGTNTTPPLTPPLSAPPVLSPPLGELVTAGEEDDDVFEPDPIEQDDLMDESMPSDSNNNSNTSNSSGKRRTQSLSALQNLQNNKDPQSPLIKVS